MKEIKCRAWDKIRKKMLYDTRDMFDGMIFWENGIVRIVDSVEQGTHTEYRKLILLLFTGLFDKNGVEIYKDDIVKYQDEIWEVFWSDILARYDLKGASGKVLEFEHTRYFNESIVKEVEVIGNIYENPELIKEVRDEQIHT